MLPQKTFSNTSNISEKQLGLQESYFNDTKFNKFFDDYIKSLNNNDGKATMKRIGGGCTGFTFFCKYIIDQSEEIFFVSKFQRPDQCLVEQLCSRIFKNFNFNPPTICFCNKRQSGELSKHAQKLALAMPPKETIEKEWALIAMPRLLAKTFEQAAKENKIQQLTPGEKLLLVEKISKISIIDLFTGNKDRFFIWKLENGKISVKNSFNSGNLLLGFKNKKLEIVYPIDNSSAVELRKIPNYQNDDVIDFGGLFEQDVEQSPAKEEKIQFTNLNVDFDKKIEDNHKEFKLMITNVNDLWKHLLNSVNGEMARLKKPPIFEENHEQYFFKSFNEVLQDIKSLLKINELKTDFNDVFPQNVFKLIQMNHDFLNTLN